MTYKDTQKILCERLIELFSWNTIDIYKVRYHNALSILQELKELINSWNNGFLKDHERIVLCIEETINLCKADFVLDYKCYDKTLFINDLKDFQAKNKNKDKNNIELCRRLVFVLDLIINSNKKIYIEKLYDNIESIIFCEDPLPDDDFKPVVDKLDLLASTLARELLNIGFSHRHLYNKVVKLSKTLSDLKTTFMAFRGAHNYSTPSSEHKVILKLNGRNVKKLLTIDNFYDAFPIKIPEEKVESNPRFKSFLTNKGNWIFYYVKIQALDHIAAIKKCIDGFEILLDKVNLGYYRLDVFYNFEAVDIIDYGSGDVIHQKTIESIEAHYADSDEISKLFVNKINKIQESDNISHDVKDRLESCVRHLRIGDSEKDNGQRLLNYWIALEFLFSSPKASASTIERIEVNLINILTCSYCKIRIDYLNNLLVNNHTINEGDIWWEKTDTEIADLIENEKSLLLRYHLKDIFSHLFGHRDKAQNFIKRYRNNIKWHIYRIYNCRNRLVHEAAIMPNLLSLTNNLHYYLLFVINQLIGYYFENTMPNLTMESFFLEYEIRNNLIDDLLKKEDIKRGDRLTSLMNMPLYNELISGAVK